MVDNTNPTNQFHPYQPPDERKQPLAGNGFGDMLSKAGLGDMFNKAKVGDVLNKARTTARSNPGALLGGLAAVAIGAGLLRKKRMS
jgi:hypothetical protein